VNHSVLYRREIQPVTLREGYRLSVFENRALRRISGPKWDETIGDWRELYDEKFQNL
jgi:hypothetical protein